MSAPKFALVMDLHDSETKIVNLSELYDLKPGSRAVRLKAETQTSFSKHKEYGRISVLNGVEKMVRHIIFALSDNVDELKTLHQKDTKKRMVAPKRQSMGAIVEPIESYTFPDTKADMKAEKMKRKKSAHKSKKTEGERIVEKFKKMKKSDRSSVQKPRTFAHIKKDKSNKEEGCATRNVVNSDSSKTDNGCAVQKTLKKAENVLCISDTESDPVSSDDLLTLTTVTHRNKSKQEIYSDSEGEKEDLDNQFGATIVHVQTSSPIDNIEEERQDCDQRHSVQSLDPALAESGFLNASEDIIKKLKGDLEKAQHDLKVAHEEIHRLKETMGSSLNLTKMQQDIAEIKELLCNRDASASVKKSKRSVHCSLSQLCNIVSSDDEEVQDGQIKVDIKKYVSKKDIIRLDSKVRKPTRRIEQLCDIFCENKSAEYCLSGTSGDGKELKKLSETEIKSMQKILTAMDWDEPTDLSLMKVKSRVSKYTSRLRKCPMSQEPSAGKRKNTKEENSAKKKLKEEEKIEASDVKVENVEVAETVKELDTSIHLS